MPKIERIQKIIELFRENKILKTAQILEFFKNAVDRTTIYRDIKELIQLNKI
ncbi:hypothetical protein [Candidatus Venteria ishoeyi]|uniref:hypothetical protein n=1 Tax=Candidatus Venteria ishoeyi TaxID=1899563 RepID=UPI0015A88552|nr:hypothetical protein [Candidatus Venteria ishoeyi]